MYCRLFGLVCELDVIKVYATFGTDFDSSDVIVDTGLDLEQVQEALCIHQIRHQDSAIMREH